MTSALFGDIARRIAKTSDLPPEAQAEALVTLFAALEHAELAPFTAMLIGELVALRAALRSSSRPSPSATPSPS